MYNPGAFKRQIPVLFAFVMIAVAVTGLLVFFINENNKFNIEMTAMEVTLPMLVNSKKAQNNNPNVVAVGDNQTKVGGDSDEHGCIGSAGYAWCEEKQKCIRSWEESCGELNTNDWNTYRNKRFKIQFKYPSSYVLDNRFESKYQEEGCVNIYTKEEFQIVKQAPGRGGGDVIEFCAIKNSQNLTAIQWAESDTDHSNFTGKYETEIIAGETAISYTFEGMGAGDMRVFNHSDFIYTFTVMGDVEMQENFKQILKTIELTDSI